MADYRISRFVKSVYRKTAVTAAGQTVVPPSIDRVSISFPTAISQVQSLIVPIDSSGTLFGYTVGGGAVPLHFDYLNYGNLAQQGWYTGSGQVAATVEWIEYILPESTLAALLSEYGQWPQRQ